MSHKQYESLNLILIYKATAGIENFTQILNFVSVITPARVRYQNNDAPSQTILSIFYTVHNRHSSKGLLLHARTTSQCLHGERGIGFDARACGERARCERKDICGIIFGRAAASAVAAAVIINYPRYIM